jgi:predicted transcriptional regulator
MYSQPKTVILSAIRVEEKLKKALERHAKKNKVKVSVVIREALRQHLGVK